LLHHFTHNRRPSKPAMGNDGGNGAAAKK
jgi:hypothetical protein